MHRMGRYATIVYGLSCVEAFASLARLYTTPDLPKTLSSLHSSMPQAPLDLEEQVRHKLAFLRDHALVGGGDGGGSGRRRRAVLIGHSIGAYIAVRALDALQDEQRRQQQPAAAAGEASGTSVVVEAPILKVGAQASCCRWHSCVRCALPTGFFRVSCFALQATTARAQGPDLILTKSDAAVIRSQPVLLMHAGIYADAFSGVRWQQCLAEGAALPGIAERRAVAGRRRARVDSPCPPQELASAGGRRYTSITAVQRCA